MKEEDYLKLCSSLHEQACARKEMSYPDPRTGLQVFTRIYLMARPCCQSECRHCPYGFRRE